MDRSKAPTWSTNHESSLMNPAVAYRHQQRSHMSRLGATFAAALLTCRLVCGADKSGVSPNTISVPKGPGSIEGLGESFQPTLNTGTANYGLDISLPPGTAGHQPSLSLSYEGGGGNSPLGYGWRL